MSPRKPPLLMRGGLTGRVYIVTSYNDLGEGRVEATKKFDVTAQYEALRASDPPMLWPGQRPGVHDHKPQDKCPQDCPGRLTADTEFMVRPPRSAKS